MNKITAQYKIQMKPLAFTEWNIFASGSKQMSSYINGMHAALTLGQMANQGFSMASRWDLANGYDNGDDMGMFNQGDEPGGSPKWNPRPCFFYMYYFQKFFGDQTVGTSVSGNSNVVAFASRFASGHAGLIVVNKGTTAETAELVPSQFMYGDRIYIYSLTGGTDNGDFSQQVFVNGRGPKYPIGGPIDTLTLIPASAYSTADIIKFPLPARSVQYVLVEPGTHVGVKDKRTIAQQFKLYQNYPNPFNPVTNYPMRVS